MSGCRWRVGWRVATVADSHVGAVGGAGAPIRGVVSGWPSGLRPVEAPATPLAPFLSQLLPCHMPRPCALFGCVFFIDTLKTKLRVRVEVNDGAPTAPAGAGGGRNGRGKGLEASSR
eukprot:scaffold11915_cov121-Isochrysis_galbana.AAC.4